MAFRERRGRRLEAVWRRCASGILGLLGLLGRGSRGKMERRGRAFIGAGDVSIKAGSKEELRREEGRDSRARRFLVKKKPLEGAKLTGGSHLSFVEEKERVPFRDFGRVGRFQI
jgi:hypothetical protein